MEFAAGNQRLSVVPYITKTFLEPGPDANSEKKLQKCAALMLNPIAQPGIPRLLAGVLRPYFRLTRIAGNHVAMRHYELAEPAEKGARNPVERPCLGDKNRSRRANAVSLIELRY